MKPSTEEFLYVLLWTAESVLIPTWRNLDDTFESWAYRNRLGRRLAVLEQQQFVERQSAPGARRLCRLTAEGRLAALGGCDLPPRWNRPWDGRWRLLLFDLPVRATALRARLRRYLLQRRFGYLQQSVWITPDSLDETRRALEPLPPDVESLTFFEGSTCGGETDATLVRAAWDFPGINALYERHQRVMSELPDLPMRQRPPSSAFWTWARREREAWKSAVRRDPLLPRALLPPGYLGPQSWESRQELFRRLSVGFRQTDRSPSPVQP